MVDSIPYGYCHCGCGQKTKLARQTRTERGWVRGQPVRYMAGHPRRRHAITAADYDLVDNGFGTPCWMWRHARYADGYAKVLLGSERKAHRAMWIQERGPLPKGHERVLHHLCRVRACVNPDHLTLITPAEHNLIHHAAR